ncbi:MAG: multicopper oxidase family protein [Candidatus Baltobacteraceae bacterium]
MNLRRFIALAVACAWLGGCGGRAAGPNPLPQGPAAYQPANRVNAVNGVNELPEPPVVKSVNGVAKVSLVADINRANGHPAFAYDGMQDVAPTIVVKPGDTIVVDLANNLPNVPPPGESPDNSRMVDDINLHFHGLGVSPKRPGDDVLTMLAHPGDTLHYVVHVQKNQEPGLYWYHTHVHGETNYQVGINGMSGAIVIDGLQHHLPGLAKMKERLIVVRATGGGETARPLNSNTAPCATRDGTTVSLNGAVHPTITIAPGEKQFFRVVNATGHKTLRLKVDGGQLELVAVDGFALDSYPGTPPTKMEPSIVVPPAGRAEFVVTGPAAGHAKFRTLCYDSGPNGDPDPELLLASLKAPNDAVGRGDRPSRPLTVGAPLPQNAYTAALPPPSAKRLVVLSEIGSEFFINGKKFSMKAPPMFVVHVGTVEEWRIVNVTQEVHDFHIHQTHFLVEKIDGVALAHPHWADSVIVPHRRGAGKGSTPGSLLLLMDFRDPVIRGEFLFHCHILDHEDHGMMAKIEAI